MNQREKARLQKLLAGLSGNERQYLYKQAAKLRKSSQGVKGGRGPAATGGWRTDRSEDDAPSFVKLSRGSADTLDDWVMRLLNGGPETLASIDAEPAAVQQTGTVSTVVAGRCRVLAGDVEVDCLLRPEIAIGQQSDLAVGDQVRFSLQSDGSGVLEEVFPRKTRLSRPDPFYRHIERVVAANIDAAVIVVAVKSPPLHPRLIDRYLIAIERGGAEPILCVNKIDLLGSEVEKIAELEKLRPYRDLGVKVITCSASDRQGVEELLMALSGKLCVFVGHSGVGKSSLLNALDPDLNLQTNALRAADGKGRHTTTGSHLYELPRGVRVIDTPGIREFGLWKLTLDEARWYFDEFVDWAPRCRFSDCSHVHEPACAVRQAVDSGHIARVRYESYRRIVGTLRS